MLVFGLLVMRGAWKAVRGEHDALFAPCAIGLFYLATGVVALSTMHEPFWSVFVVLGGLALMLSAVLGLASTRPRTAPRLRQPAAYSMQVCNSARITACTGAASSGRYSKLSSSM
jgi:hypothetical protein